MSQNYAYLGILSGGGFVPNSDETSAGNE